MRATAWIAALLLVGCPTSGDKTRSTGTVPTTVTDSTPVVTPTTPVQILGFEAALTPGRAHQASLDLTLDTAASATVECVQTDDPLERHRRVLAPAVESQWALHGLLAATTYDCTATAGSPPASATARFTTEAQLSTLQTWYTQGDTAGPWGAYTVINTFLVGAIDQIVAVYDPQGRVRWTHAMGPTSSTGLEATWTGEHFLIGGSTDHPPALVDLDGDFVWQVPPNPDGDRYHHEGRLTPGGTLLALRAENVGSPSFVGFVVEEWDPATGAMIWEWSAQQGIDQGALATGIGDVYHANSVSWVSDAFGDGVIISLAHADQLVRVDKATGSVRWTFGRDGTIELDEDDGDAFYGQHDPEWTGDRVLLHDNGRQRPGGVYSRLAEYTVDTGAGTAELVWEWTEGGWFEPIWGDADRLPDGRVLISRGHCGGCGGNPTRTSDVSILNPTTGAIEWSLRTDSPDVGVYRADRIDGCALFENTRYCSTLD